MLHQTFGRKLNRDIKERKALFKSLIVGLINSGKINTSLVKAKAISGLIDKIITHVKDGSNGAINKVTSFLGRKDIVDKLTKEIVPVFSDRVSGFTRMRRIGKRKGDNTEEVILEWTVKPQAPVIGKKVKKLPKKSEKPAKAEKAVKTKKEKILKKAE